MTDERREAIIRLLQTRDDHLPEPVRRTEASRGFVHSDPDNTETCSDCLANDRVMFGCETCGGSGRVAAPRSRDPYAKDVVVAYGLDGSRHEATRARDRQIEILGQQLRPASTVDEIADANAHPWPWEVTRQRKWNLFDYAALDRALEQLRNVDHTAYRALHAVHVYAWAPSTVATVECERGVAFLSDRLPDPLRAPAPERYQVIVAKLERSAGPTARAIRDDRIRLLAAQGGKPAEIAASCFVSIRTVYNVVREMAA